MVAATAVVGASAAPAAPQSTVPESVRRDLAASRAWKASTALEDHLAPLASASMEDRIVLAEAQTGWRNWSGAVEALTTGRPDTAQAPPRYWYLLGTAMEAAGDIEGAADALRRFVASAPAGGRESVAARSRLVRLEAGRVSPAATVEAVAELRGLSPVAAGWTALAAARTLAEAGEAEAVWGLLALAGDGAARNRGWRLEADAWAARGDTARALEALDGVALAREGREDAENGAPTRTAVLGLEWRYRLALGDTTGAVSAMWELLARTSRGAHATEAALVLWQLDAAGTDPDAYVRLARALGNGREYGSAVRAWEAAQGAGATLSEPDRMSLARAYNGSRDRDAAVALYRQLSVSSDPERAARALRAWADIRRVQGRHSDMRILEDRLVERYPAHPEALDVIFFAGDDHHDGGRLSEAVDHYQRVVSMSSGADRAGLARMRWAQIHLSRGEPEAAAKVFQEYLEEFPSGRRWEEAAYWGAQAAEAAGDSVSSASWAAELARLRRDSPLSYYALLTAEAGGAAFGAGLPVGSPPPPPEGATLEALELLSLLEEAGLDEGATVHTAALVRTARSASTEGSDDALLGLAAALNERGRTRDAIELGWELRRRDRPWNRTLARVVFPFPHQDLVTAHAEELGLDPYLVAGLIRQESAFAPAVVSSAGAVGLMQILPATGRELARRAGPRGFRADLLETPEVNIHLGTTYLARLMERYDGDVPLALSAYNAGPTRANRWRRFPEAADPLRFTERIPFAETRGYVKNVTRNRALYRWLYGGDG